MSIVPVDTSSEVSVTDYLTRARDWLSRAVDETGPEQIAAAKAEITTAAVATKQLGLSKEIQLDAQEMVRRAEYALGRAIRKGQAEGFIAKREDNLTPGWGNAKDDAHLGADRESPSKFVNGRVERRDVGHMSEATRDEFDEVIAEAKTEGNLSRANVARKAREKSGRPVEPAVAGTTERAHQEAELVNAFAAIVRRSLTPKNVATLTPKARARLISILNDALNTLKETSS